jgi:hypothetical protein
MMALFRREMGITRTRPLRILSRTGSAARFNVPTGIAVDSAGITSQSLENISQSTSSQAQPGAKPPESNNHEN